MLTNERKLSAEGYYRTGKNEITNSTTYSGYMMGDNSKRQSENGNKMNNSNAKFKLFFL